MIFKPLTYPSNHDLYVEFCPFAVTHSPQSGWPNIVDVCENADIDMVRAAKVMISCFFIVICVVGAVQMVGNLKGCPQKCRSLLQDL